MVSSDEAMNNLGTGTGSEIVLLPSSYLQLYDDPFRGYPHEMFSRRADAILLHRARRIGGCTSEEKICFFPDGRIDKWHDNLYGFTRVVVYGKESLCAVCKTEDLDRVFCQAEKVDPLICNLHNALIYEADDLTIPCGEVGKMTSRRIEKPFVAVSVEPSTNSGNEASDAEYNVDRAIKFLKEEMDSGATSTFLGTLRTAVFTLDHLFGKTFEANEIKIFSASLLGRDNRIIEYPIRGERCVQDYLNVIHKPCSGGPSRRWRLVLYKHRNSSRNKRRLNVINKARERLNVINKARKRRLV